MGVKYSEGSQGPETTAEIVVVFLGTKKIPDLEELSTREEWAKEKLFTGVLSSEQENTILTFLYSVAFITFLPNDVIARGIKIYFSN